jgi:hypothetical protein
MPSTNEENEAFVRALPADWNKPGKFARGEKGHPDYVPTQEDKDEEIAQAIDRLIASGRLKVVQ